MADLTRYIMTIQAHGDKEAAAELLAQRAVLSDDVKESLDRLAKQAIPVDIESLLLWQ